jgi:hypothetical protein
MSTTVDLRTLVVELREALAAAPAGPRTEAVRAKANAAREAHALTPELVQGLVKELTTTSAPRKPRSFPTKHGKDCERCGERVEEGKGLCERDEADTRWIVTHKEGDCPVLWFEGVPEGRYAIDWSDNPQALAVEANVVCFYQIKQGTLYAQASSELYEIKDQDHIRRVLDAIKVDPRAASVRYGIEMEHCGVCGRPLTADGSRELGIGPVCIEKMGW